MKTIKVSEATPIQLDWLVAQCEGLKPRFFTSNDAYDAHILHQTLKYRDYVVVLHPSGILSALGQYNGYNDGVCIKNLFRPSTDWPQGGPIIERERISVRHIGNNIDGEVWDAGDMEVEGSTPLIAGMRCYVASKLGDEVEVPDELVQ